MSDREIHPIMRARERYGVTLTDADLAALEQNIRDKKTICLHKAPMFELHLLGLTFGAETIPMVALFRPATDCIVTFYPKETASDFKLRIGLIRQEEKSMPTHTTPRHRGLSIGRRRERYLSNLSKHERQLSRSDDYALDDA